MPRVDLATTPHRLDMHRFATEIIDLAHGDWIAGKKQGHRTGEELVSLLTINARGLHRRMASTIYNSAIRTFECGNREAS